MSVNALSSRRAGFFAVWLLAGLLSAWSASASVDVHQFDSPAQAAQYQAMIDELRCPKCQNQNLAGSDAPIAQDLKQKTYEMVKDGQTDQQIREYMIARYGDFISYRPPVRPSTWILWFLPPLLLVLLIGGWLWRVRRMAQRRAAVSDAVLSASEQARLAQVLAARSAQTQSTSTGESHDL